MDKKIIKEKRRQNKKGFPTKQGEETMAKIMASLQKVDIEASDAKLNETSMDDNNGGRVIYFIIDSKKYVFKGNKKKTLELLRLLEDSLTLVSLGEKSVKNNEKVGFKIKPSKTK